MTKYLTYVIEFSKKQNMGVNKLLIELKVEEKKHC
jgi:hypothetical protein